MATTMTIDQITEELNNHAATYTRRATIDTRNAVHCACALGRKQALIEAYNIAVESDCVAFTIDKLLQEAS